VIVSSVRAAGWLGSVRDRPHVHGVLGYQCRERGKRGVARGRVPHAARVSIGWRRHHHRCFVRLSVPVFRLHRSVPVDNEIVNGWRVVSGAANVWMVLSVSSRAGHVTFKTLGAKSGYMILNSIVTIIIGLCGGM
jgi:hypothetical protein